MYILGGEVKITDGWARTDHVLRSGHGGHRWADGSIIAVVWRWQQHGLLLLFRDTNHTQTPWRAPIAATTCDTWLHIKRNLFYSVMGVRNRCLTYWSDRREVCSKMRETSPAWQKKAAWSTFIYIIMSVWRFIDRLGDHLLPLFCRRSIQAKNNHSTKRRWRKQTLQRRHLTCWQIALFAFLLCYVTRLITLSHYFGKQLGGLAERP